MKMIHRELVALAALLVLAAPLAAQDVELAPGESLTVRALADTVVVVDTLIQVDTVTVTQIDTVFVTDTLVQVDTVFVGDTVPGCPPEWTCTPPPVDPPEMDVEADSAGLAVRWAAQPADSFWVYGARDDTGADEWDVILPGSDTSYHRALSYTELTPMLTCVVAIRLEQLSVQSCETVTWSPPEPEEPPPDELPGAPGRPGFEALEDGRVRVTWGQAERATSYLYWYTGHAESEGLTTPTNSIVLDDFEDGGFFCTRGVNELGPAPGATYRCNSYRPPPEPDPDPPDTVSAFRVIIEDGDEPATGDPIALVVERSETLEGSWEDDTAPFPDSVTFEVEGEGRHVERGWPYRYPGDPPAAWSTPDADSIRVEWAVYGAEQGSGRFTIPIVERTGGGEPDPESGMFLELWSRIGHEEVEPIDPDAAYNLYPGKVVEGGACSACDDQGRLPMPDVITNIHPGHGFRFKVVGADSAQIRVNDTTLRGSGLLPPWPDEPDWTVPRQDSVRIEWTAWPGPVGGRAAFAVRCFGGPAWTFEERGSSC